MSRATPEASVLFLRLAGASAGTRQGVPLRFLRRNGLVYVFGPSTPRPGWMEAMDRGAAARWWIGGEEFSGHGRILRDADPAVRELRSRAQEAWGSAALLRWFGGPAAVAALVPDSLAPTTYYESLESLFDADATAYDDRLAANPVERLMREASLEALQATFPAGSMLLELGCGTGAETLPLAQAGYRLVAVDLSAAMLDRLASKAVALGVSSRIQMIRGRAGELASLTQSFAPSSFDGAFSTFGALNTEPGWRALPSVLARLLRPGARMVVGVWNRTCASELALYALRGRPRRALARFSDSVPVGLSRFGVPVRAYAPAEFLRPFLGPFVVEGLVGLPVLLPPYDFWEHLKPFAPLVPVLGRADAVVRGRFPWNRLGDHFLAVLGRRADAGQTS